MQMKSPMSLREVEFQELAPQPGTASALPSLQLKLFAGVKTRVEVVAGHVHSTVGELLGMKDGAILTLDRQVDAPFDVVLDGHVIARGQLVAVGDQFGLRVTEVCQMPQS
jgi:flagellar motor switch protein FliN/FliY